LTTYHHCAAKFSYIFFITSLWLATMRPISMYQLLSLVINYDSYQCFNLHFIQQKRMWMAHKMTNLWPYYY